MSSPIILANNPTAIIPLAKFLTGTNPSKKATPANIPIAAAIRIIVAPTLSSLFPAILVESISPAIIKAKKAMPISAFAISLTFILAIIFATIAIKSIAAPTPTMAFPTLPSLFPASLVAAIRPVIIAPRNVIPIKTLGKSSYDILAIILHTTAIKSIALDI